jgi:hypothetical protein
MSWLTTLRSNPISNTLAAEVLGINAPRILTARTPEERLDVTSFEALNTVGFFGSGLLLNKAVNPLFKMGKKPGTKALQVIQLGKSVGMYSFLGSYMFAVPFFRNYLTARIHQKTDFKALLQTEPNQKTDQFKLKQQEKHYLKQVGTVLGSGVLGTALVFTATRLTLTKPWLPSQLPNLGVFVQKALLLGIDEKSKMPTLLKMPDIPSLFVWGLTSYAGAICAARDKTERREQWIKAASFTVCFSVLPHFIKKAAPTLALRLRPSLTGEREKETFHANTGYLVKLFSQLGLLIASTLGYQQITANKLKSLNEVVQTKDITTKEPSSFSGSNSFGSDFLRPGNGMDAFITRPTQFPNLNTSNRLMSSYPVYNIPGSYPVSFPANLSNTGTIDQKLS